MTKVSLLGDSIRLEGYGKLVPSVLGEDYDVFQPQDNCRFAMYTFRGLYDWREAMEGSRVVHWNNGLWDCCDLFGDGFFTSVEDYVRNMCRVADLLLSRHDKVIFATTTPTNGDDREKANAEIRMFNAAVVPALEAKGVIINDLYSVVAADLDRFLCEDRLHLSEEGRIACANQVAEVIKAAAEAL
ncbi:MAG: SGNH/GDSL hydrolase family protein [Clostridia bacterium]|nr:SGNH/GDSL hydrolase family protein [Clostridia bacterium]